MTSSIHLWREGELHDNDGENQQHTFMERGGTTLDDQQHTFMERGGTTRQWWGKPATYVYGERGNYTRWPAAYIYGERGNYTRWPATYVYGEREELHKMTSNICWWREGGTTQDDQQHTFMVREGNYTRWPAAYIYGERGNYTRWPATYVYGERGELHEMTSNIRSLDHDIINKPTHALLQGWNASMHSLCLTCAHGKECRVLVKLIFQVHKHQYENKCRVQWNIPSQFSSDVHHNES